MINEERIRKLTETYICAYNVAMEKTKNPAIAMQTATSIILAMTMKEPKETEVFMVNPLEALFSTIKNSVQEEKKSDGAENEEDQ